ncbi:MAG: quinone oxidoreductase [Candidatus Eremiobacteraeota bacterium]|nr:quinone oxidoreductase [Candidatus Eremiobacteraeota bacterium]
MQALYFRTFGGPEVLQYGVLPDPTLATGSVLVRTHAIGLNFADVYRRNGNYHLKGGPPYILGYEAAGVIADGPGAGTRVGFADAPFSNAELVAVPAEKIIALPPEISNETAAAVLLQGLTAHYLVNDSHCILPGERVLVHAAAGGVGLLLVQLLKVRGAYVVALASTDDKCAFAKSNGADEAYRYDEPWQNLARNCDVVYDSIGSTLDQSLDLVRTGGHVVFYGMAGGNPKPIDPRRLMDESKTVTGGDLWNVLRSAAERVRRANELFALIVSGGLHVHVDRTFALKDGSSAHRYLESRRSKGKVLLIP